MNHTHPRRAPRALSTALLAAALGLAGCAQDAPTPEPTPVSAAAPANVAADEVLAAYGLDGLPVEEVIEELDAMPVAERPTDLIASVRPDVLLLTDASQQEYQLPIAGDDVYVSVAPYVNQTHECHFHSLTTCRGELAAADVHVTVTGADGEVVLDEDLTTYDNGFVGFWVPRGVEGTLTVESDGRSGSTQISTTSPEDRTCVTDLQLS